MCKYIYIHLYIDIYIVYSIQYKCKLNVLEYTIHTVDCIYAVYTVY